MNNPLGRAPGIFSASRANQNASHQTLRFCPQLKATLRQNGQGSVELLMIDGLLATRRRLRLINTLIPFLFLCAACSGDVQLIVDEAKNGNVQNQSGSAILYAFRFAGPSAAATISGLSIDVKVPVGTDLTNLVAIFRFYGSQVKVGSTTQINGATVNDFTNPVVYRVVASNGSFRDYTVTVSTSTSDIFAPAMTSATVTPSSVNSFPATVTIRVYYTESGGSGVSAAVATLCSPSYMQSSMGSGASVADGGTNMGSYFEMTVTLQSYHEPGDWKICSVYLTDNAGNIASYGYIADTFPGRYYLFQGTTIFDTGQALYGNLPVTGSTLDITPPQLTAVDVTPATINTFPTAVNIKVYFTELGSGFSSGLAYVCSPSRLTNGYGQTELVVSLVNQGAYAEGNGTINSYHQSGAWRVCSIYLKDIAGNTRSFTQTNSFSLANYTYYSNGYQNSGVPLSSMIAVSGTTPDITPPAVLGVTVTPGSLNTYPGTVTIRVDFSELGSGLSFLTPFLCSPTYLQSGGGNIVSAATTNFGTYAQGTVTLQNYHETGPWKVCQISLSDNAGNYRLYHTIPDINSNSYFYSEGGNNYQSPVPIAPPVLKN